MTGASRARQRNLVVLLCVIAAVRMLLVVLPAPMYGYANNYDFMRVSAWFDLWPATPDRSTDFDRRAQHPSAPLRCYEVDHATTSDIRYPTAELGFVWLALRLNDLRRAIFGSGGCEFDLRLLGLLRAAILLGAGITVTLLFFRRAAQAGVASALILALVLSDPAVLLLFNTLYSDFSTVLFSYLAAAEMVYVLAFASFGIAQGMVLGVTLLALAAAKMQYAGLSLGLFLVLVVSTLFLAERHCSWRRRSATLLLAGLAALAGLLAQQRAVNGGGYMWSLRMCAATDTFFGAILAHHSAPERGLAILGLPARCRPYVGRTWYDEGMQPPPCPEVGAVARSRLVPLFLDDPGLVARLAARAVPLLKPLIVRYYGQVEGGDHAQADARWSSGIASVSQLVEVLPTFVFAALLALGLLGGAVAIVEIVARGRQSRGSERLLPILVVMMCSIEVYAFASSLLGDGFIDLARHAFVGQLAFLVLAVASPLLLARSARRGVRGSTPRAAAYVPHRITIEPGGGATTEPDQKNASKPSPGELNSQRP